MCIALGNHNGRPVSCRKCWQCQAKRADDWTGRLIAESKAARACNVVTLTYGKDATYGSVDHERATVLTYSDIQKWVKRLRRAGHAMRYFAAGEYGSAKARAHWHVIVYWLSEPPQLELRKRVVDPFWDHGFAFWDSVDPATIKYTAKYIRKDQGAEHQGHFAMSKKPPLGAEYFRRRAVQFVEQYLAPQDLFYSFPEVIGKGGRPKRFLMGGKSADLFLSAYVREWRERHGDVHAPWSELVADWDDKQVADLVEFVPPVRRFSKLERPWLEPPGYAEIEWSETHKTYCARYMGYDLYWTFDSQGDRTWAKKVTNGSASAGLLPSKGRSYREEYKKKSGQG